MKGLALGLGIPQEHPLAGHPHQSDQRQHQQDLAEALQEHWPRGAWWGVFAGHNHAYLNQSTPFDGWPAFREYESSAAKGDALDSDVASAMSVVTFEGAEVALIEEHFYVLSTGTWVTKRGV